jgi:hypothetical protein
MSLPVGPSEGRQVVPADDPRDWATFSGPWCEACCLPRHDWPEHADQQPTRFTDFDPCLYCQHTEVEWNDADPEDAK